MRNLRVREILTEIAMQPALQWERLLAKRFPADPAMVQQALLWLHADHERFEDERDPPSLGEVGNARYELAVKLGSGASATVWQAFDRKLGRNVAIKILHAHYGEAREQLIAEARAASDVISDHVVRILDVHDGERPYIVMELVGEHDPAHGELSLGTAASACEPRDVDEVASWVMRVARGVHDAHARNVFHRDIKPRNVLITPISRRARIADFGLAVSTANEPIASSSSALICSSANGPVSISGTPEYMSPEQARGLPLDLDPHVAADREVLVAIDVWGLGALAYGLLAGRPPWGPRTTGGDAWEKAVSGGAPTRLERTSTNRRIPRRLRRIVEKAMALDPVARYRTAGQVALEIEAYRARQPTSFDRSRVTRAWLWGRRNPQLALTAMATVGLVALVFGTHATVTRLRTDRDALKDEVSAQHIELERLDHSVAQARSDFATTARQLAAGNDELATLQKSIEDQRKLYETVLQAKDRALREATAATRRLVDELEAAKTSRHDAETRAAQSDTQLVTAQRDVERATKERDRARRDRDQAQSERDTLKQERDSAIADRDDARKTLERLHQDLARVSATVDAKIDGGLAPRTP